MVTFIETPAEVEGALAKLSATDREIVENYILKLQSQIAPDEAAGSGERAPPPAAAAGTPDRGDDDDDDTDLPDLEDADGNVHAEVEEEPLPEEPDFPPVYASGDDVDAAANAKMAASDAKEAGDWDKALQHYTEAVLAAPPSSLLYANRADALLRLGRPRAAVRDCDLALSDNPDSAKALRVRGKARKELRQYELALSDLSASQQIDFDENTVDDLKFLAEKRVEKEKKEAEERLQKEAKLRQRAQEAKKAREQAKAAPASAASAGGSGARSTGGPFSGAGGGGFPGMGGMEGLMGEMMKDPELLAALQNPKVISALSQVMGAGGMPNPAKMQELMSDPEVGPVLQKLMGKMAGKMPGGGPGGFPGASGGAHDDDDDDAEMPDLDDLPDLE